MKIQQKITAIAFFGLSQLVAAQIREEVLILERKREPEIRRIEKKQSAAKIEKNYPPREKRIQDSLNLRYDIVDVQPVSEFKTSEIEGADLSPEFKTNYQRNFVRLGMGNYGKVLGDGNISAQLNDRWEAGADVHYLSTSGLKNEYPWDSDAAKGDFGAFLNYYGGSGKAGVEARYLLNDYHFYGIYAMAPGQVPDLHQKTNTVKLNGHYDFYSNKILDDVRFKTFYLTDHFDSEEQYGDLEIKLKYADFFKNTSGIRLDAGLNTALGGQSAKFKTLARNQSDNFYFSIAPHILLEKNGSYLKLGFKYAFLDESARRMYEDKISDSHSRFYPDVELLFSGNDRIKLYAGATGETALNTYSDMLERNPWLVPDQALRARNEKYKIYAGIKGDMNAQLKYDIFGGYSKVDNAAFFAHSPLFDLQASATRPAYDFANAFNIVYANATRTEVQASLQWFPVQNLVTGISLAYSQYDADNIDKFYNNNYLKAQFSADYKFLQDRMLLGFQAFYRSGNDVRIYEVLSDNLLPDRIYSLPKDAKTDAYFDINLSAEYKVHKNFSIFALGNNLTGRKYQDYYGYRVLGAQITGGIKLTF